MTRDEVILRLKDHATELKQLGVEHLYLFGSMTRNEQTARSDVDLFFDYPKGHFSLFDLMDVKDRAAEILNCKVDIMTRDSIHNVLRNEIEKTSVAVF